MSVFRSLRAGYPPLIDQQPSYMCLNLFVRRRKAEYTYRENQIQVQGDLIAARRAPPLRLRTLGMARQRARHHFATPTIELQTRNITKKPT